MKKIVLLLWVFTSIIAQGQKSTTVKEFKKVFTTYPFSDPNPIPDVHSRIYPYFRFDGFTEQSIQKEWKVVELENDFIKVMILPEVGGKIWSATEKKTGKDFLYNNHVVKFRDVAMRGPWTSGGIEANYGTIGHTPNCATPVDYINQQKEDGSASCIIGVLDLLTQTQWRLEINLPKDKAYFTTQSFWHNATALEQPYYSWMNTGIKAKGNLEFVYPGTHYLGHEGEYNDWPVNKSNGKKISFYEQNNFGTYKSYHVFGTYTDFFGGYWHDDDYGMARYATHDDKAGKKIWIWGLSQQGMIWDKLLTDSDGQYVEVQSGRLFNQSGESSVKTPFKYRGFSPNETDEWTEYWFPVVQTKGFVKANEFGALNVRNEKGWLKINFCPIQNTNEDISIQISGNNYRKHISLQPLQAYADSVKLSKGDTAWTVSVGNKIQFSHKGYSEAAISRPVESPVDFDWSNVYGLYLSGKSWMEQRQYAQATEKINACLQKDPNYTPALVALSELEYRKMNYTEAFNAASRALSINTYDGAANYYYALTALQLNKIVDAKDGFDLAVQSAEYRVPAFTQLAYIYFKENQLDKAASCAKKSLTYNRHNLGALQLLAVIHRKQGNTVAYDEAIKALNASDPLNHFTLFEKYLVQPTVQNSKLFLSFIKNELPSETCTNMATWYYNIGCMDEMNSLLALSPEGEEVNIWRNFFSVKSLNNGDTKAVSAFPFREETASLLQQLIKKDNKWQHKYALGLIYASKTNTDKAKQLFEACGNEPNVPAFYAARAMLIKESTEVDLQKAISIDKEQWRYKKLLAEYYIQHQQPDKALVLAEAFYPLHKENYIMGMLYAKTLLLNKRYKESDELLSRLRIIPFEGATDGRVLYREGKLQQALSQMQTGAYTKALPFINAAEGWPENLGVGKPYEDDIDTRLESWMRYLCYQKINKPKDASVNLQKIIAFTPRIQNTVSNFFSANHLITAWAIEKAKGRDEALQWLNNEVKKYPNDKVLTWVMQTFEKRQQLATDMKDANILMLMALIDLK
jgi:tetratricopeptide (TPR) repeat protein